MPLFKKEKLLYDLRVEPVFLWFYTNKKKLSQWIASGDKGLAAEHRTSWCSSSELLRQQEAHINQEPPSEALTQAYPIPRLIIYKQ